MVRTRQSFMSDRKQISDYKADSGHVDIYTISLEKQMFAKSESASIDACNYQLFYI